MVGIPTNVCRISLILVHTNWLENGLASKVAACQLDGQGLMPGRPKYFFLSLCHIWTAPVPRTGYCSNREWVSFVWVRAAGA